MKQAESSTKITVEMNVDGMTKRKYTELESAMLDIS